MSDEVCVDNIDGSINPKAEKRIESLPSGADYIGHVNFSNRCLAR